MTLPPLNPETTAAGIAVDPKTLDRVVPATRRADGTVRKELKIRPGFTPQEDAVRFRGSRQQNAEQNTLPKGHIVGWVPPSSESKAKRGGKPVASTSSGGARSLEALASGRLETPSAVQAPVSKSAKKNAKRSEKKKEEKQKTLEERIKAAWDDDSDDDIPRPAKKGKAPAASSTPQEEQDASSDTAAKPEDGEDGTSEVAAKVKDLSI
ncbi:hypothetical protein M408DRAFT_328764 [Serendipita vermifera MAFF 305830]|uniref:WIBG Mago-binding domain-containing protein n=1 Tax=Serendipita vermifera MAFF 305830 TaxID=933852 RepID=A0A0C3AY96_SERVB|nr:hypothetical protein M408DRAFT_328764 [Serendipita vermifera MAFF 305830]